MPFEKYPTEAISRARSGALEWLQNNADGFPRSWAQEARNDARRGYVMYDAFEAPPIAGYDVLERDGLAERLETVDWGGQERVHFRLRSAEATVSDLDKLLNQAVEACNAMTPAEREKMHDEQRKSWVRGEIVWPEPKFKMIDGVKVYESYEDYCNG